MGELPLWTFISERSTDLAPHDEALAKQEQAGTAIYRAALVPIAERLVHSSYFTPHDDNIWSYERAEQWLADQATAALVSSAARPQR